MAVTEVAFSKRAQRSLWTAVLAPRLLSIVYRDPANAYADAIWRQLDKVAFGNPSEEDIARALGWLERNYLVISHSAKNPKGAGLDDVRLFTLTERGAGNLNYLPGVTVFLTE